MNVKEKKLNNYKNNGCVGIYCRVSTQNQVREGFSLSEQQKRLKKKMYL